MSGVEFQPHDETVQQEPIARPPDEPQQAPPAARRPRRLWFRSLTSRLTAGVVALVIVVVATIGSSTYYFLRSYLLHRLDQQVASSAQQNGAYIGRCVLVNRCYLGPPPATHEWITVLNLPPGLSVSFRGPNVSNLSLSKAEQASLSSDPTDILTVYSGGQELRVTGDPQVGRAVVVTGLSTSDVHTTLRRLVVIELIIGASAVLVAFVATSWGVRRSLRNLYRVTGTAQEVAAELSPTGAGLDRRVDVPDDGTEVGQLAESMNTLLAAVETQFAARLYSEERLRQFVADASHELRTPLTSIRGYAELARMQKAAGANADDNLARIESEGTRMSRLVDDLLMLARGDQSRAPRLELIDVAELLDDAVNSARAAMPGRPVDVEHPAGLNVVGDRDQLYRVVSNLIGNANMHTAAGRPVLVRCYGGRSEVVIQVIDGGPGLPPEEAAHVFERFWRADKARSRARGGTGLGLSIVAAIVDAHGGTVRFDSTVERGSTVTVRLPAVDT